MRIAQVSPLIESVPPVRYGGTERVVFYLTEELVALGHEVTLFASADSITNAHLIPGCARALQHDMDPRDVLAIHLNMLQDVVDRSPEFDIIHFHTGNLHYALTGYIDTPHITTLHNRLDNQEAGYFYRKYTDIPVVSVSAEQRKDMPGSNWQATVYHGIPEDLYEFRPGHREYLAFLGSASPENGIMEAIEIAQRADMPLKIAAKVHKDDEAFFNETVKPLLADPRIEFIGEINNTEKNMLLGDAYALLYPIKYPKPFGLTMVEAMACGVPVIAFRGGSVEEVIQHGVTGYIVDDLDEAVYATGLLENLSRKACHDTFIQRFTAPRMANDYLSVYKNCMDNRRSQLPGVVSPHRIAVAARH